MKATTVATALTFVALLLGASATFLTLSLQASVGQLHSDVASLSDNMNRLFESLGLETSEQAKVVASARKEGKVVLYGTIEESIMKAATDSFESVYPFLKVEYWRAASSGVFDRVLSELKSGNPQSDVVIVSPYLLNILKKEGAFQKHLSPEAGKYPKEFQFDPDGVITPFITLRPIGIVYNKQLVKPEEAPKTLGELLDPKWKGKIVMPDPAQHPTTSDWLFSLRKMFKSDAEWEAWIRALGKNQPLLVRSFIPAVETVIRGEKPVGITYIRYVYVYDKAPLDYTRISPSLGNVNSLALGGKAPHPNAGKLFINFMLSKRALEAMASAGENVTLAGIYPPIKDINKIQTIPLTELTAEEYAQWAKTFSNWLTS